MSEFPFPISTLVDTSAGNACTDRGSNISFSDSTVIINENPVQQSGNITSWCLFKASATGQARLKVFRSNGANWDFVGQSALENITVGGLSTFTTNIAVQAGDYIGAYLALGGTGLDADTNLGGDLYYRYDGEVSSNVTKTDGWILGHRLSLGATVSPSLVATHNLDIYVEPHSWYTPGGAASQITGVLADISGAIINGMTEAGLTAWTYLGTDIITEVDRVIIRIYLKETTQSPPFSAYPILSSAYPALSLAYPGIRKLALGPWTIIAIGIAIVIIGIGMIVGYVLYRAAITLLEEVYTKEQVGQYTNDILDRMVDNCDTNFPADPVGYANCVKSGIQSVTGAAEDFFDDPTIGQSGQTASDNIDTCIQEYNNPSSPKYHDSVALKTCVDTQNQGVKTTITNQTKSKGNPFGAILLLGAGLIGMYIITKPAGQAIPVVIKESRK